MNGQILRRLGFLIAFVSLLGIAGCLISSDSSQKVSGSYVAESTFDKIQPGKTSAGWVKATLGEPNSKEAVESTGSEIWKYSYTQTKESSGAVFLLFSGHDTKETTGHAYVEMKDGVVVNKWRG
jgi:hypothetical protein